MKISLFPSVNSENKDFGKVFSHIIPF